MEWGRFFAHFANSTGSGSTRNPRHPRYRSRYAVLDCVNPSFAPTSKNVPCLNGNCFLIFACIGERQKTSRGGNTPPLPLREGGIESLPPARTPQINFPAPAYS